MCLIRDERVGRGLIEDIQFGIGMDAQAQDEVGIIDIVQIVAGVGMTLIDLVLAD